MTKKRAIVTGGAGLIGSAICEALFSKGWDVASFDLKKAEAPYRSLECDVADEHAVDQAFKALEWDKLDFLVNNAGIANPDNGPIHELALDDWRKITDSHLTSAFLMTRRAVPLMREGASIVNMVSTRAFMSEPQTEAYAASKGGLTALTHALAISLGPRIRVNAIAPGWITDDKKLRAKDQNQHPVGRVGKGKDIVDAVLYLTDAGFMTGQVLVLDGGMTRKMIYEE